MFFSSRGAALATFAFMAFQTMDLLPHVKAAPMVKKKGSGIGLKAEKWWKNAMVLMVHCFAGNRHSGRIFPGIRWGPLCDQEKAILQRF